MVAVKGLKGDSGQPWRHAVAERCTEAIAFSEPNHAGSLGGEYGRDGDRAFATSCARSSPRIERNGYEDVDTVDYPVNGRG